jgi:hypothetical protein
MTLKDKFEQWFINDEDEHYEGMVETVAIEHEKVADEFAIDFAEWCVKNELFYAIQYGRIETKELLKIYKKEKGL